MKKIIALVLALVMVLSLGTVAFAGPDTNVRSRVVLTNVVTKLLENPAKSLGYAMQFNKAATVNAINNLAPAVVNAAQSATEKLGDVVIGVSYLVEKKEISDTNKELKEAETALGEAKTANETAQQEWKEADETVNTALTGTKAVYDAAEATLATLKAQEAAAKLAYDNDPTDQDKANAYLTKQGEVAEAQKVFDDAKAANDAANEVLTAATTAKTEAEETLKACEEDVTDLKKDLEVDIPNTFSKVRTYANYAADYIFEEISVADLAKGTAKAVRVARNYINEKILKNHNVLHAANLNYVAPRIVVSDLIPETLEAMVKTLDRVSLQEFVDPDLDTAEKRMETLDKTKTLEIRDAELSAQKALSLTLAELEKSGKSYVATLTGEVIDAVSDILTKNSSYKMYDMDGEDFTAMGGVITMLVGYVTGLDKVFK